MSKLDPLAERAIDLAGKLTSGLKQIVPGRAEKWLTAGATLGALKTGGRVAARLLRRNPALAVATAAGAGLLWYAARRKAHRAAQAPIEGSAKRVEARRGDAGSTRRQPGGPRQRGAGSTAGNGAASATKSGDRHR